MPVIHAQATLTHGRAFLGRGQTAGPPGDLSLRRNVVCLYPVVGVADTAREPMPDFRQLDAVGFGTACRLRPRLYTVSKMTPLALLSETNFLGADNIGIHPAAAIARRRVPWER